MIRVSFVYEPEPEALDPSNSLGITEAEYERMISRLSALDAEDIEFEPAT